MKKKYFILCLAITIFISMVGGCRQEERSVEDPLGMVRQETLLIEMEGVNLNVDYIHHYDIRVELDENTNQLTGKQVVKYVNNTKENFDEIYFNIFPNAFKDQSTAPTIFNRSRNEADYQGGYIQINNIWLNDKKANYEISGMGDTLLKIPLEKTLNSGSQIMIEMDYTIQIPNARERFGVSEGVYNLGNWYPIAAVYDEKGWNLEPYYSIGDPFYSEVANYNVEITLPKEMILATSGNIQSVNSINDKKVWKIETKLMRDFAWCSSRDFQMEETLVGDTIVKMYFLTKDRQVRQKATEYTVNSLKTFNRVFGPYPYGQYSVVATTFPSGMEYPGLVYIGQQYYDKRTLDDLELIIVHETGHQWWYGVVGNDQINEAWLDESLTTYSEMIYYREVYGEDVGIHHHKKRNEEVYITSQQFIEDERILRPISNFDGWMDYGSLVYHQGARMIYALEEQYGKDKIYEILRNYYEKYQFKVASSRDFIEVCQEILGENMEEFFNQWLLGQ